MTKSITRKQSRISQISGWSDAQINLIRQTVAANCSPVEMAWFLYNAKRLDFEPTLDEVYLIKYSDKKPAEIVVGIGGYRKQADSSGVYAGSDKAEFEYEYEDESHERPSLCRVTVWKIVQGMRCPFVGEVRWSEFYPGDGEVGAQWRKRPHNQMAVRAESHALRKAFPHQTARLEVREAAPQQWIEAAEADMREPSDPELVARNAAMYDRVFGEAGELPAPKADPKIEAWARNRVLMEQASALGIRRRELRNTSVLQEIEQANAEIEEQIEAAQQTSAASL